MHCRFDLIYQSGQKPGQHTFSRRGRSRGKALSLVQAPQSFALCRYNDREYAWVADDTWTYETEFNVTDAMRDQKNIDLVLEGVDTVAEVYVNDEMAGELNNAHRQGPKHSSRLQT